ncbi:MAG: Nre family DNA repair protein [Candidatus Nanohaloarchaea archaeon]|nr:Nre family DNA repair protein [Candidatus Nanohaloarchaea archaeon]
MGDGSLRERMQGMDAGSADDDGHVDYQDPSVYRDFSEMFKAEQVDDEFFGASPPTIFVGRHGYPEVNVGVLSPVEVTQSADLDAPTAWYERGLNIRQVISRRSSLVNSRQKKSVHDTGGFGDAAQEIAMASDPVDIEVGLDKTVDFDIDFSDRYAPYGPSGTIERVEIAENPSVPRAVEKAVGDDDWTADGAMTYLYEKDLDTHQIQRVLSAGLLGERDNRRMVPTRWSITASDDTVGKQLREEIKTNQELGEIRYFRNEHLGNIFHILLIPGQWEYELVEIKGAGSIWAPGSKSFVKSDHEGYAGRTQYVDETAGGYHAARLGPLEYLDSIGRQAKVLIVREVTDDYWAPLGVWVVRETVRGAFDRDYGVIEDLPTALENVKRQVPVDWDRIRQKSKMVQGMQTSLHRFAGRADID